MNLPQIEETLHELKMIYAGMSTTLQQLSMASQQNMDRSVHELLQRLAAQNMALKTCTATYGNMIEEPKRDPVLEPVPASPEC